MQTARRRFQVPLWNIVAGVGLVAAVAAPFVAWLALRDSRPIREIYHDYPPTVLSVVEPIEVLAFEHFLDGGTTTFNFRDANDEPFYACADGRMDVDVHDQAIYVGAPYPTQPGARRVAAAGPEEAAL